MSIIQNYQVLNEIHVWVRACDILNDTETIARIRGVEAQMAIFHFFYGLVLGEMLLCHTDNLSRALKSGHTSAAEGQVIAMMTASTLSSIRNDEHIDLFWEKVNAMATKCDIEELKLPRQRKRPRHYEEGAPAEFHSTAKGIYCRLYYEAVDLIVQAFKEHFDQPGYKI